MRNVFVLLLLIGPSGPLPETRSPADPPSYSEQQILDALRVVESGGRDDCPDGDRGLSIGPFQICKLYWTDALSFDRSLGGKYQDCRDRNYAEKVVRAYMQRYVGEAWKKLDAETIARTHNGGPRGARKASTLVYWEKVKKLLAEF